MTVPNMAPGCIASGCKCMPKAHCMTLCVETLKTTLTPEKVKRIAGNEMPACFNVTRELLVALAQLLAEAKLTDDVTMTAFGTLEEKFKALAARFAACNEERERQHTRADEAERRLNTLQGSHHR